MSAKHRPLMSRDWTRIHAIPPSPQTRTLANRRFAISPIVGRVVLVPAQPMACHFIEQPIE